MAGGKEQLELVIERIGEHGRPDARRWILGQTWTEDRVGLLMCGDLMAAARCLGSSDPARAVERVAQLLRFSTTEDYFELREAIW